MFRRIRSNLETMSKGLSGPVTKHAHPIHRDPLASYVRFIEWLLTYLTQLENKMAETAQALTKVEASRDAWKSYAQAQKTAADQAKRLQQAAEDKLAAIPLVTDAEDAAAVKDVLAAPDDLPPTDTGTTTPPTTGTGDTTTPPATTGGDNTTPPADNTTATPAPQQ